MAEAAEEDRAIWTEAEATAARATLRQAIADWTAWATAEALKAEKEEERRARIAARRHLSAAWRAANK